MLMPLVCIMCLSDPSGSNAFFSREVIPRTPVPPSINLLMNRRGGGELISELEMNSSSTLLGGGGQEQISKERGGDLDVASELEPVFLIPSYGKWSFWSW